MSAYASYIANLNGKTNITATEDIINDKGVILIKAGAEFNENTYSKILNFKLMKPLEDSIFLEFQLNPQSIYQQIIEQIKQDASLNIIHQHLNDHTALKRCCARLKQFPILLQKLTVLDMELTDIFFQSLVSAYCAHVMAIQKNQAQDVIDACFLAGLFHDIGLLHIDRYILTKKERLTADEWRKVQSHPLIGYQIVKNLPDFPQMTSLAILEHHEKTDGSGYPRSKKGEQLSYLGQVISLLDNVIVIYNRKLKPIKRNLSSIIPILQINMHAYFSDAITSTFKLLKLVPTTTINVTIDSDTLTALIEYVQELKSYINHLDEIIKTSSDKIGLKHSDQSLYNIQNEGHNINFIMRCAGLSADNTLNWESPQDVDHLQRLYSEIDDTRLLLEELLYNLNSYQKSITVYIDQHANSVHSELLNAILSAFSDTPAPSPNQHLHNHWHNMSH